MNSFTIRAGTRSGTSGARSATVSVIALEGIVRGPRRFLWPPGHEDIGIVDADQSRRAGPSGLSPCSRVRRLAPNT